MSNKKAKAEPIKKTVQKIMKRLTGAEPGKVRSLKKKRKEQSTK